jgi:hypothetical protein
MTTQQNVVVLGTEEHALMSQWLRNVIVGSTEAFVLKPAEVVLSDTDAGIGKAWAEDWDNLGRDMSHVLNWAHERDKQAG